MKDEINIKYSNSNESYTKISSKTSVPMEFYRSSFPVINTSNSFCFVFQMYPMPMWIISWHEDSEQIYMWRSENNNWAEPVG
jgi:hypothetical protein